MTNIERIINKWKEKVGLPKPANPLQLSERVAKMRPSPRKVAAALEERPDRFSLVQKSPLVMLFEYTIPQIKHILVEMGEDRTEQIIGQLCEHGRKMIEKHGAEGAKNHLEGLFKDLPAMSR